MDDRLEKLIRELRDEKCPRSVTEQVARRTGQGAVADRWWRVTPGWSLVGAAGLTALVVAAMLFGPGRVGPDSRQAGDAGRRTGFHPAAMDRAMVIEQAQGALVFIGRVLIEAGARTESALTTEAVPPLVEGFRTATTKLTKSL